MTRVPGALLHISNLHAVAPGEVVDYPKRKLNNAAGESVTYALPTQNPIFIIAMTRSPCRSVPQSKQSRTLPKQWSWVVALIFSMFPFLVPAQTPFTVPASPGPNNQTLPKLEHNDAWVFRQTIELIAATTIRTTNIVQFTLRSGGQTEGDLAEFAQAGKEGEILHMDSQPMLIRAMPPQVARSPCMYNPLGLGSLSATAQCPFPFRDVTEWSEQYTDPKMAFKITYTLIGIEDVSVTAGAFKAFKIVSVSDRILQAMGSDQNASKGPDWRTSTCTDWYSPAAKIVVKSECELLDGGKHRIEKINNELIGIEITN